MKARVKAKQVEILSDSMKQIIEVNKEYHRQILDLKKKLQNSLVYLWPLYITN